MIEQYFRARRILNGVIADISMRTGASLNRPTYICALMTMRCNSLCAHCNIWSAKSIVPELTSGEWKATIKGLSQWLGRFTLAFTGGEALLRSDMIELIRYAKERAITVRLNSNGLIIGRAVARDLVEARLDQITVSFDGIVGATHDRLRGQEGFFEKTHAALKYLGEERSACGSRMRIQVKTVINRWNVKELPDIAEYAIANSLEIIFQPIEQSYGEERDRDWYKRSDLWVQDLNSLRSSIEAIKMMKKRYPNILNSERDLDTIVDYFESPEKLMDAVQSHDTRTSPRYCRHAVSNFVISANGDVRMCFKMEPIGNVLQAPPESLWHQRERCWKGPCGLAEREGTD